MAAIWKFAQNDEIWTKWGKVPYLWYACVLVNALGRVNLIFPPKYDSPQI